MNNTIKSHAETLRKKLEDRQVNHLWTSQEFESYKKRVGWDFLEGWRCLGCNVDMGPCNPRQYCEKTFCPDEGEIWVCPLTGKSIDLTDESLDLADVGINPVVEMIEQDKTEDGIIGQPIITPIVEQTETGNGITDQLIVKSSPRPKVVKAKMEGGAKKRKKLFTIRSWDSVMLPVSELSEKCEFIHIDREEDGSSITIYATGCKGPWLKLD